MANRSEGIALSVLNVAYPFAPVGPASVGGAEQVLSSLDRYLHAHRQRSLVLACEGSSAAGELFDAALPEGVLDDATRARAHAAYGAQLRALLDAQQVDVAHLHGVDFHAYLPDARVSTVVTLHLPLSFYPADALASALARPNLALCCVSEAQRQSAAPALRKRLRLVPNGVALAAFGATRAAAAARAARAGDRERTDEDHLLVLSRICPEKGVHIALDAAHRLDLAAIVAGRVYPYPEHQRYFEREIAPRLDAKRRFVGPVALPEKARLLARARCLLVPSLVDETSSLASMEALAAGTPVVALRRGALPEVLEHGVTGFVVDEPGQLAAAVQAISQLDRTRCRAAAAARFSDTTMCERYLALYRELAAARGERSPAVCFAACASRFEVTTHAGETAAPIEIAELRTLPELEALQDAWRELWQRCPSATVFQRPEWLLAYVRHLLQGELQVLALWRAGALVGLAPFFVWRRGARRVLSLLGAGVSDYQDVLFDPAQRAETTRALERWLAAQGLHGCAWSELVPDSPLLALATPPGWDSRLEPQEPCPALVLSAEARASARERSDVEARAGARERSNVEAREPTEAALLPRLSKNLRQSLKSLRRAAARDGLGYELASAERLPALLAELHTLHAARRAQLGDAGCFVQPEIVAFHAAAAPALLASGLLRMHALTRADGTRVALLYALREREALRLYQHGFDPALARYSPGTLLCAHAIECAMEEGASVFDFLRGAENYKYRWGATDRLQLTRRSMERVQR